MTENPFSERLRGLIAGYFVGSAITIISLLPIEFQSSGGNVASIADRLTTSGIEIVIALLTLWRVRQSLVVAVCYAAWMLGSSALGVLLFHRLTVHGGDNIPGLVYGEAIQAVGALLVIIVLVYLIRQETGSAGTSGRTPSPPANF